MPNLNEAIKVLEELKSETEKSEWVYRPMKRAVLAGIESCLIRLRERNNDGSV